MRAAEDEYITMLNTEALLQPIEVLKREVQRQREKGEILEANETEQVVFEMMEVISGMQDGFSETVETERALTEKKNRTIIQNIKKCE